jgi:hypothetical protein
MRCYGAQADNCTAVAEYHALTGWSFGTVMLCRDCVAWEREVDGLLWVHTARPGCPLDCHRGAPSLSGHV